MSKCSMLSQRVARFRSQSMRARKTPDTWGGRKRRARIERRQTAPSVTARPARAGRTRGAWRLSRTPRSRGIAPRARCKSPRQSTTPDIGPLRQVLRARALPRHLVRHRRCAAAPARSMYGAWLAACGVALLAAPARACELSASSAEELLSVLSRPHGDAYVCLESPEPCALLPPGFACCPAPLWGAPRARKPVRARARVANSARGAAAALPLATDRRGPDAPGALTSAWVPGGAD